MPCGLSLVPRILSFLLLYPCSSKRLVTLARGLSPAFLRFGGKRTDFLQFQNLRNPAKSRGGPGPDYYLKNYEDGEKLGSHFCWVGKVWGRRGGWGMLGVEGAPPHAAPDWREKTTHTWVQTFYLQRRRLR